MEKKKKSLPELDAELQQMHIKAVEDKCKRGILHCRCQGRRIEFVRRRGNVSAFGVSGAHSGVSGITLGHEMLGHEMLKRK